MSLTLSRTARRVLLALAVTLTYLLVALPLIILAVKPDGLVDYIAPSAMSGYMDALRLTLAGAVYVGSGTFALLGLTLTVDSWREVVDSYDD